MYFYQQTGALHAVCWSKSVVSTLKSVCDGKDWKTCLNAEKMILISEQHREHPFVGGNTQHYTIKVNQASNCGKGFLVMKITSKHELNKKFQSMTCIKIAGFKPVRVK